MINTISPTLLGVGHSPARELVESRYQFAEGAHELVLHVRDAGQAHAKEVREGAAEFALLTEGPLLMLGSRFGKALPWSFAPYCWHLVPAASRVLPPAVGSAEERRAQVDVVLTGSDGSTPLATTCVALWLDFSRALHEAIREQARLPFDPSAVTHTLADLRRRYPTPAALLARASCHALASH